MTTRIKLRRDTAANWTAENPILAAGEPGLETDTGKVKYGDGVTRWNLIEHTGGDTLTDDRAVTVTVGNTAYFAIVNRANNNENGVEASGVAYDSEGNMITLHVSEVYNSNTDVSDDILIISKFDDTGALLWQKQIEQDVDVDQVHDLAVDGNDDIFVAASVDNDEDPDTIVLIKLTSSGSIVWQRDYLGTGGGSIMEVGAMVLSGTDIFVAGDYDPDDTGTFIAFIMKVSAVDGTLAWAKTIPNQFGSRAWGVDVTTQGDPVIVGEFPSPGGPAAVVIRFNGTTGAETWSKVLLGNVPDMGLSGGDIVIDSQNNIFVSVNSGQNIVHDDDNNTFTTIAHVVKLNSLGETQWARRVGPGPCASVATGIDCDDSGNVYLAALTVAQDNPTRENFDFNTSSRNVLAVAKYSTAGAVLWQRYIETDNYEFYHQRNDNIFTNVPISETYSANRGRNMSIGLDGKLAIQVTVRQIDADDYTENNRYYESITFQIDQDGREMTVGSGNEKFAVKESRIPGKTVTLDSELGSGDLTFNDFANDITVTTATLTLADGELAQSVSKSAPYEYVFGNDGTLTIPNDGDIKLTQTQVGWFSVLGPANNNNYYINIRGSCVDPNNGDVYIGGEEEDNYQGVVTRYNSQGQVLWSISLYDNDENYDSGVYAMKIHPTRGSLMVLANYDSDDTMLFEIDPDTAKIVSSAGIRSIGNNDVDSFDFDFLSDGKIAVVGQKFGEYQSYSVTPLPDSGVGIISFLRSDIPGKTINNFGSFYVAGTGITNDRVSIDSVNRYPGLTTTVREGNGAEFTVEVNGAVINTESVMGNIVVTSQAFSTYTAYGYSSVTSPTFGSTTASSLAELYYIDEAPTPYTRLTLTPGIYDGFTVNANGLIANDPVARSFIVVSGGAQMTPEEVSPGVYVYFNRTGDVFNLASQNTQTLAVKVGYSDIPDTPGTYSVLVTNGGTNYLVGHKVKVLGSALGGTTPENDVIITVDGLDGGAISSVSRTGDANVAAAGPYTAVAHANYNVGSGCTATLVLETDGSIGGVYAFDTPGTNYVVGDVLTVAGTQFLGGASPANNFTMTVTDNSGGGVGGVNGTDTPSGTGPTTHWRVQTTSQTPDYSGEGTWTIQESIDGEAFVYVTTAMDDPFASVWTKVLSAGGSDDSESYKAVAVDSSNNIYAVGNMIARNNSAGADLNNTWCAVVSKFNSSGAHQWTKALNPTTYENYGKSVAVRGNTIAVTHTNDDGSTFITKLDATGAIKWQRQTTASDTESSVAIDTNGDIYVVSEANMESQYNDCIKVIRLNTYGEVVWRKILATQVGWDGASLNDYLREGRNLSLDATHLYVSGVTTAYTNNNYNGFLVKLPKSGDQDGVYGSWTVMTDSYDVDKINSTEATAFTPIIGTGNFATWNPDFSSQWWDPSNDDYYHTLTQIHDRDGGAIEFADGTRQTSSAQQIPQKKINNGADHRLSIEDMGKHIYVTNSDTRIAVPYHNDVPLPIGFTVVIINNSGGTISIDGDGYGNIDIKVPGVDTATYWDLDSPGMATLIKVENDLWFMTGNVSVD
jgi:hypothetical protein